METQEVEFFVHGSDDKPKIVNGRSDEVLRDVLIRAGALREDDSDALVFIGECEQAREEPPETEDGADEHEPAEAGRTLHDLGVGRHCHVHVHRCRLIAVQVNFQNKKKYRRFSPAATVGTVANWARRKFHLDPATAPEYVLQICGTTAQPRSDTHLGELTKAPDCSLCFDLVKEVTPQG